MFSLDIFAAPVDREGTSLDAVWTYVIYVLQANPELVPFPKVFGAWNDNGCQMDGFTDGDVEADSNQLIKLLAPGAHKIMVVTEGNQQTQLEKVCLHVHCTELRFYVNTMYTCMYTCA